MKTTYMNLTQKSAIKSSADAMGLTGETRQKYEKNPTKWIDDNVEDYKMSGETRCLLDGTADKMGKLVYNTGILIGLIMIIIGVILYFIHPSNSCGSGGIVSIQLAVCGLMFSGVGGFLRLCMGRD